MSDNRRQQKTLRSRRKFIKAMAGVGCLPGCALLQNERQSSTSEDLTPTGPPPKDTAPGVVEQARNPAPENAESRVVQTRHPGVWQDNELRRDNLRSMLDRSIVALTDQPSARAAWAGLFKPTERIAIKVNVIGTRVNASEIWTHPPLVMELTECLIDAGIPAENIHIYDRYTDELKNALYPINRDGSGVRCYGTDDDYVEGLRICDQPIRLSRILLDADALINVPVLKAHIYTGVTYALKNHYGTFDRPEDFHKGMLLHRGIAELNALAPIRTKTRLIVGDLLSYCTTPHPSRPYWKTDGIDDMILMSTDPVAIDTCSVDLLCERVARGDGVYKQVRPLSEPWLKEAQALALGVHSTGSIEQLVLDI